MNLVSILEQRVKENPNKTYLLFRDEKISYREFNENANRIANSLHSLGIRKGDHVGAVLPNNKDFLYLFFAVAKLGAVNVFINDQYDHLLLKHALNVSDCKAVILEKTVLDKYGSIRGELNKIELEIAYHDKDKFPLPEGFLPYSDLLKGSPESPPEIEIKPQDPVQFVFTSGTTGSPKPCILCHKARIEVARQHNNILDVTAKDIFYSCLPNYHGNPYFGINGALLVGGSIALGEKFSASRYWEDVKKFQATILVIHHTPLNILLNQPPKENDPDNTARAVICAGSTATGAREFMKRFDIRSARVGYGATEAGGTSALSAHHLEDEPVPHNFCGKPRSDIEIEIVDEDDKRLKHGQVGEIVVRPMEPFVIFSGYYNMPDRTLQVMRNLWYHTGDFGHKDERGFLYFDGRKTDSVRVKGEFVPIDHVENIIRSNTKVKECAIVGVPSDIGEQEIKLYVQPNKGSSIMPEEIVTFCRERLARFMVPRYIEIVEELPISPSIMKVQRNKLKEQGIGPSWDVRINAWLKPKMTK